MVIWPPGGSDSERGELLIHELWHRIQDDLGLPGSNPANSHLDSLDGRTWLRLECVALSAALRASPQDRPKHVENALLFLANRRSLFADAAKEENALELNEGLAEYTGLKLNASSESALRERAAKKLDDFQATDSFMRSFAYATGPAWCLLLDEVKPDWRKELKAGGDLSSMLNTALPAAPAKPDLSIAKARVSLYRGESISAEESQREEKRQKRRAELTARYIEGPILRLPFRKMNIEFNPNNIEALGDAGTFYPTLRITDEWGILTVTAGALIDPKWSGVQVPVDPRDKAPVKGEGWTLELSPKARIEPGSRSGDWTLHFSD